MIKKIDKHFEVLDVIKEEVDDIQTVIDYWMFGNGSYRYCYKKLEIIQDKLMGVKENVE